MTTPIPTQCALCGLARPLQNSQWNLGSDGSLWVMAPNSVDEVGCIHTCQGLGVDYIGVIIGPDLVARGGGRTGLFAIPIGPCLRGG